MSDASRWIQAKDAQVFWDRKAKTFPRYSPEQDNYEARVLALAAANGVVWRGARILDVGCGTGMYTLRLAQEAREVTALDFSEAMLDFLREDSKKLNLKNIEIIYSDWRSAKLVGDYDIIFCSMCPAMGLEGGLDKLIAQKKAQVVYIGWNGLYRSDVLEGLVTRYAYTPKKFDSVARTKEFLTAKGLEFLALPIEGTWRVNYSQESLLDSVLANLSDYGVEPQMDWLNEYLEQFRRPDGQYLETTDYKIQALLWRNP
ncbi:MAG: methyltransferase domain-containing protein [Deltaproteobacteria bacterium]|jgi:SAM-dependent methyltransferase|nr:methyltransferase domain-containing protein [Deltaproteobacteria bacterium]